MKIYLKSILLLLLCSCGKLKQEPVVEIYYGQEVKDSYRYLENTASDDVIEWIHEQNSKTEFYLSNISNQQQLVDKQMFFKKKNKYSVSRINITDNNYIFYLKRKANENFSKLYYRKNISGKDIELFDPKDFDPESKSEFQINYIKPNWDGSKILISLMTNGEEFSKMIVLDVQTKKRFAEVIENCKPSSIGGIHWLPSNDSFSYIYIPNAKEKSKKSTLNTQAVIYKVGSASKEIRGVFSKKNNPEISIESKDFPIVEIDNAKAKYAVGIIAGSTPYSDSYYLPVEHLKETKQVWKPFFKKEHKVKSYTIMGDDIVYLTANNSPNFKICKTSFLYQDFDTPEILIPERKNEIIKNFAITEKGLFYSTVVNGVKAKLYQYYKGEEIEISLPRPSGNIKLYLKGQDIIISIKGWLNRTERYLFNYSTNSLILYDVFSDRNKDSFDDLTIEEITVKSRDGEEIPLSLIYKKGIKRNGNNRVLMRGYGAYGASMVPSAYYPFLLYVREGGIYAVAHVRGGGEKGDKWYRGGLKSNKPNTWKDFIACTEYLIDKRYTSKGKIAVWGGSAGGILIGRAITERPDLYGAAIIERGMFNMIRIEEGINGANSAKEFGSVKDSIGFKSLYAMDSYHHVKNKTIYPPTLITTGINDSRVPPWQSMKFAARLQEANTSRNPILLKTEFDSGHGLQSSKDNELETIANILSFALMNTGHPDYRSKK